MDLLKWFRKDNRKVESPKIKQVLETIAKTKQEVNLDDYYEQVTTKDLKELTGKYVTIMFRDLEVKYKIKANPFPDIDGYRIIRRVPDIEYSGLILSRGPIFPSDIKLEEFDEKYASRLYKIGNGKLFITSPNGIDTTYINKTMNPQLHKELDKYLGKENIENRKAN